MSVATLEMKPIAYGRDCKTYLLYDADTKEAAIIDPRFDHVSRYMTELEKLDLKLKYAFDTHTHADHLSGSDRLRNLTACAIVMSDKTKSKVADYLATDGEKFKLGGHELTVLHTPGHTPDSMSIFDGSRVYTGDTLFIGGAARTDFMGGDAGQLYDSFRKLEALGWESRFSCADAIERTALWYAENQGWWRKIKSGQRYQEYYRQQYQGREVVAKG